jgi:hypothetical protein
MTRKASPALHPGRTLYMGGILRAGRRLITNAIKSLPSRLTVNHSDGDEVCQITVHLALLEFGEFPIQLIQLNYLSLQA